MGPMLPESLSRIGAWIIYSIEQEMKYLYYIAEHALKHLDS